MVTHQLQAERRTAKARQLRTDVLPLNHATNVAVMLAVTKLWTSIEMPTQNLYSTCDKESNDNVTSNWRRPQSVLLMTGFGHRSARKKNKFYYCYTVIRN